VIWGHKLHTHTHSYIHYGYYKGFSHLGYETFWLDAQDDVSEIDFSSTLFLTEGQVDQGIPLRNDCTYVLHNCDLSKYCNKISQNKIIKLNVYFKACEYRDTKKMAPYVFYNLEDRSIYMPWATDLLPHEIQAYQQELNFSSQRDKTAIFVGSCAGTTAYSNLSEIENFRRACTDHQFRFIVVGGYGNASGFIGINSNIALIQESFLAPAIQGPWQCGVGYIPCRIFKNISYGKLGITNNETVYDLFEGRVIYNPDCYQLFLDAMHAMSGDYRDLLLWQMNFVCQNHTYLNRIDCLMRLIEAC